MAVKMCILCVASLLCAGPLAAPLAAPLAEPFVAPCAALAHRYAERYQLELDIHGGTHRVLKMRGRSARLAVWGARGVAPEAAALLRVTLRHALGYEAAVEQQDYDVCTSNLTQLAVAASARFESCAKDEDSNRLMHVSKGVAGVGRAALWARPRGAPGCPRAGPLGVRNTTVLAACRFLTLPDLRTMESELPPCGFKESACAPAGRTAPVVLAAGADPRALLAIDQYICKNNLPLRLLLFNDTTCFRKTLQHLLERNSSYLFFDDDFEIDTSDLLQVNLVDSAEADRCPGRGFNEVTDVYYRIGDGPLMRKYAPQIADVVERFCPSLKDLQEISRNRSEDELDIEAAACRWALQNNETFESWITNKKHNYIIYVYICTNDPLNDEYIYIIQNIASVLTHESIFKIVSKEIDCHDGRNMNKVFTTIMDLEKIKTMIKGDNKTDDENEMMGFIAWSSSQGVADMASTANQEHVPLALVGPVAPDANVGASVVAAGGRLQDLARAYRAFIRNCEWSRLAILSDDSSYAKSFKSSLFDKTDLIYVEKKVNSNTLKKALETLQEKRARIIIVNTNSSLAVKIIQLASQLGMTPPLYAWIVREWSPGGESANVTLGAMSHYSLSTAWRGVDGVGGGHAAARTLLQKRWRAGAWPALAAPLTDALLSLHAGFNTFAKLYSSTPLTMRNGGYAMSISQILDKTGAPGVQRNLSFHNGTAEGVMVYLEEWQAGARTELAAWPLEADAPPAARCTARVIDRPACSFPADGRAFVQRCYDVQMYSLFVALTLLPVVFAVARRARLKRLQIRDLNLLAQISESKHLSPVVRGDLLCIHKKIGTGNFGNVYLATLRQSKEKPILVAAKALRDDSGKEEYLHEAGTLQLLDHENIVKFVGICVSNGSLLILMEYAHHGDLLQYLRARRHLVAGGIVGAGDEADEREVSHVRAEALTRLAREAAGALQHLARRGLVHRDVRAANCLIDERRTLKLADFGMARRVCDNREYTTIRCAMFPVLWMAPESLSHGTFSSASDMWSLGVLCLELATLGARPYGTCAPHQVLTYVRSGGRPPLPPDASTETVSLVMACWRHDAAQRARAEDVERFLARRPRALRPALLPAHDALPAVPAPYTPPAVPAPDTLRPESHSAPDILTPAPSVLPTPGAMLAPDVLPTTNVLRERALS